VDHFLVDWEKQQATCPQGHTSPSWTPAKDLRKNEVIEIKFSTTDCQACPARSRCTRSTRCHCHRSQSGSLYGVVQWASTRSNSALRFCSPLCCGLNGFASSINFAEDPASCGKVSCWTSYGRGERVSNESDITTSWILLTRNVISQNVCGRLFSWLSGQPKQSIDHIKERVSEPKPTRSIVGTQ
jgi:hypothetical protein